MKRTLKFLETSYKLGQKLGLETMKALLELLDNPQDKVKIIHVAGTNGKGSTCAMLTSILTEAGFKTGFYSSPHLISYTERMRIGYTPISEEHFTEVIDEVKKASEKLTALKRPHPTEFEILTAAGYLYFAREKCDFALMEVGLGGRLDATNALNNPFLTIITPVGFDHEEFLGHTLTDIAHEKAGIMKSNHPVVISLQDKEALDALVSDAKKKELKAYLVDDRALKINGSSSIGLAFSYEGGDYEVPFRANYQVRNALTVLEAVKALRDLGISLDNDVIKEGLAKTQWSGRFEVLQQDPLIIIDGAHNPQGVKAFTEALEGLGNRNLVGLLAVKKGKDYSHMIEAVEGFFREVVITRPHWIEGVEPEELAKGFKKTKTHAKETIEEALDFARSIQGNDPLVCFGSLYLIGEVKRVIEDEHHSS